MSAWNKAEAFLVYEGNLQGEGRVQYKVIGQGKLGKGEV